ncbi:MAG: ABC transporter ATP-binding protein [Desulfobacteraceae bacterium]|nr:ABC transporter ATP-binding protein [Desulfobacteraceae bacterium]
MEYAIEIRNLEHKFGKHQIYKNLNLLLPKGKIYGLLGKNGVGKTTLIKILMGFLRPGRGQCKVLGEPSHALPSSVRQKVGLLFEGHLAYEFLTIEKIEKFYAPYYPDWDTDIYWNLVDKLKLPRFHRIANMSEGQRSQIVLGLIMAQQPELLILDDYSMGLDAGYRRLFIDYMKEYLKNTDRTLLLTSHVIQDMENFVDEVIFLEKGGKILTTSLKEFCSTFNCYQIQKNGHQIPLKQGVITNVEDHAHYWDIFSFAAEDELRNELGKQGLHLNKLKHVPMNLEDAFIGYTGRY